MIIKNKDLDQLLKNNGRTRVLTLYINSLIYMTNKQLNYVLNYKKGGGRVEKSRV